MKRYHPKANRTVNKYWYHSIKRLMTHPKIEHIENYTTYYRMRDLLADILISYPYFYLHDITNKKGLKIALINRPFTEYLDTNGNIIRKDIDPEKRIKAKSYYIEDIYEEFVNLVILGNFFNELDNIIQEGKPMRYIVKFIQGKVANILDKAILTVMCDSDHPYANPNEHYDRYKIILAGEGFDKVEDENDDDNEYKKECRTKSNKLYPIDRKVLTRLIYILEKNIDNRKSKPYRRKINHITDSTTKKEITLYLDIDEFDYPLYKIVLSGGIEELIDLHTRNGFKSKSLKLPNVSKAGKYQQSRKKSYYSKVVRIEERNDYNEMRSMLDFYENIGYRVNTVTRPYFTKIDSVFIKWHNDGYLGVDSYELNNV